MIIVAILEVRLDALDMFRAYESQATQVMQRYGGCIAQTVVVAAKEGGQIMKEVHIVKFPDESAFRAYRADPTLKEMAHLRDRSVISTQILIGTDGPNYHSNQS